MPTNSYYVVQQRIRSSIPDLSPIPFNVGFFPMVFLVKCANNNFGKKIQNKLNRSSSSEFRKIVYSLNYLNEPVY